MNADEYYLTSEGAERLRRELAVLKGPKREAIAKKLRHAIQLGDLTENAEYIMAKEEQAFLEGRILELETLLREAVIVQEGESTDHAQIGSFVVVSENGRSPETFQLVGAKEANPRQGKISHLSPIGKALLGKAVGEEATVETPGGKITLKVLEIR